MTTIIAHVSDLHVNSRIALMPTKVINDDGLTVLPSKLQSWIWDNWLDYWQTVKLTKRKQKAKKVIGIINGDWGDKNSHDGYQLVEPNNRSIIIDMMLDVLKPTQGIVDQWIVVRGTSAHTGGSSELEEIAAKELGAVKDIDTDTNTWYVFRGTADGVNLTSTHHPGTTSGRPWTLGADANRRAAWDVQNYAFADWWPKLTLWGHYHHHSDSAHNHPIQAIFARCWKADDSFTHKIGIGTNPKSMGGLIITSNKGEYDVEDKHYDLPAPKVMTL